jgi:hypothetical protein
MTSGYTLGVATRVAAAVAAVTDASPRRDEIKTL